MYDNHKPKPVFIARNLARGRGCEVPFLLAWYPELISIEVVCAWMKWYVRQGSTKFLLNEVNHLAQKSVGKSDEAEWKKCVIHCIKVEV